MGKYIISGTGNIAEVERLLNAVNTGEHTFVERMMNSEVKANYWLADNTGENFNLTLEFENKAHVMNVKALWTVFKFHGKFNGFNLKVA